MFIIPLEIILKICYNLRYNVGVGIPVDIYVFIPHRYQEMLSANSTFLPALFLSRRKDSVFNCLYFTTPRKPCQGIFEKNFSILKITDAVRPTPHQSLFSDSFSSKEKPIEFSNMPKLSPLRGKWRA